MTDNATTAVCVSAGRVRFSFEVDVAELVDWLPSEVFDLFIAMSKITALTSSDRTGRPASSHRQCGEDVNG